VTNRVLGHWDDKLEEGPTPEPFVIVDGHKVYRKESCTLDHKPVRARRYFGLWQCRCCNGLIVPSLRRKRVISLVAYKHGGTHTNGHNGNGHS
jgi:hypothetical protein